MAIIAINLQTGVRMRPGGRTLVELQALPGEWAICEELPGVVERHQKLEPLAPPENGFTHRLVEMTRAEKDAADAGAAPEIRSERETMIRTQASAHVARLLTDNADALAAVILGHSPSATAAESAAASAIVDAVRVVTAQRDADIEAL